MRTRQLIDGVQGRHDGGLYFRRQDVGVQMGVQRHYDVGRNRP